MTTPLTTDIPFNAFFESGKEEVLSPFLKPSSRRWAHNLDLKAALLAGALLFLAYLFKWYGYPHPLSYLLLLLVYFLAGIPSLIETIEDLANFQVNIDVLMTMAAFGSVLIGSPYEGGLLLVLFSISGAMELAVTRRAKSSLQSLHKLAPTRAIVMSDDGLTIEKAIADIVPKTKILIRAGQVVPLDGEILEGISSLNMVHLTGESLPVTKQPGDTIPAGALNLEGALVVSVTHTSADSTLARIIKLVTEAQEAKPTLQRWFDRLSEGYAKTIITLSFIFALALPWIFKIPFLGPGGSIYRSLAFLIAASPCALIIAIPIAYLSAIGACARKGILLKGGITLDALASCEKIAFDKTGTLTTGELECIAIHPLRSIDQDKLEEALDIAFAMEQNAVHPIAKAVTQYCMEKKRKPAPLSSFKLIPGYGLEAETEEEALLFGNADLILPKLTLDDQNLLNGFAEPFLKAGEIIAFLLRSESVFILRFRDKVRPHMRETMHKLKQLGYQLMMLTGDHFLSAARVGQELEIDLVYANLKPEDKLKIVSEESAKSGLVMVGDGVNDAPALARATVGVSMGKVGSSAAIEAADAVLLQDSLENLSWLLEKSKKTQTIVKQNLIISTLAIIIASLPALAGFVPLWLAVVMHEGGTVLVGLNGIRLLK